MQHLLLTWQHLDFNHFCVNTAENRKVGNVLNILQPAKITQKYIVQTMYFINTSKHYNALCSFCKWTNVDVD